jgi:hypothetical protein
MFAILAGEDEGEHQKIATRLRLPPFASLPLPQAKSHASKSSEIVLAKSLPAITAVTASFG